MGWQGDEEERMEDNVGGKAEGEWAMAEKRRLVEEDKMQSGKGVRW